ncbi:MAG: small multi-drug export protein [Methanomicrobia archaeon]|nr:small multi-drug export protein [Methanomicrobia archaeon]
MPGDFAGVLEILWVILTAMTPISELRGAIPLALFELGMSPVQAYLYSVIGNMLPVIPLLLFLEPVSTWLRRYRSFDRFFDWLFTRTRRYDARMEKYGALGLASFVAIPLPMTGAWTGCAVAFVFGIRFKYAFPTILAGVLVAGVIVTLWYLGVLVIL